MQARRKARAPARAATHWEHEGLSSGASSWKILEGLARLLSDHMSSVLVWVAGCLAVTCDVPGTGTHASCLPSSPCLSEWPHTPNRHVLLVGDWLMSPGAESCSPVSQKIAADLRLNVENMAVAGMLASELRLPTYVGEKWVVLNGGVNDLLAAHSRGQSLDLDLLMSATQRRDGGARDGRCMRERA